MFDIDKFKEIWLTIKLNKLRSFLTGFGVAWGIFMFIIMLGVGNGFFNGIQQNIDGIAHNPVFVFPSKTTIAYKGFNAGRYWQLKMSDIEVLKENIPQIQYISGTIFGRYSGKVMRGERSGDYGFKGVDAGFFLAVLILAIIDKITQTIDGQETIFADPQISFPMAIGALTTLIFFGLLAGIILTLNALKIKAIDAIREE